MIIFGLFKNIFLINIINSSIDLFNINDNVYSIQRIADDVNGKGDSCDYFVFNMQKGYLEQTREVNYCFEIAPNHFSIYPHRIYKYRIVKISNVRYFTISNGRLIVMFRIIKKIKSEKSSYYIKLIYNNLISVLPRSSSDEPQLPEK